MADKPLEKNVTLNDRASTRQDILPVDDMVVTKVEGNLDAAGNSPPGLEFWQSLLPRRFLIIKALGKGGHGRVFLARDDQLDRLVAIKISFQESSNNPKLFEAVQREARALASLDHPNIVSIYDVGKSGGNAWFIVSRFLEGGTLSQSIRERAYSPIESSRLVSTLAMALQYLHEKGLVHLDVKPDNILLDQLGNPSLVDFGLAIREGVGNSTKSCGGTPAYMSPEQANGEGHRIDCRSDIFSLGIIFYEMLTGKRLFEGKTLPDVLEKVSHGEIVPPSRINPRVSPELERICMKALCRRMSDRYGSAKSMANELVEFLECTPVAEPAAREVLPEYKGLRAFDQGDAAAFLGLLPGPKDREGLSSVVRFWRDQMSAQEDGVAVGVMYGPSGCGKSSLMKAGILPRLPGHVLQVYLEASAVKTESNLLARLQAIYPSCAGMETLADAFCNIRKESNLTGTSKVVVVLDQFEQWLLHNEDMERSGLLQALRQADGLHMQVVLMVRDDFMLGVNRLMGLLEIPIVEGRNFSLVDLFDREHSIKVLRSFGRSMGRLPLEELQPGQKEFIEKAVAGLAVEGRGVPVRLSMFSEMMKTRDWSLSSLESLGGLEGLGVQFFEETFGAHSVIEDERLRQAPQDILEALLPVGATHIKGAMVAVDRLREISGFGDNQEDFSLVIRWLDEDLRLITPVMQDGKESADGCHYILAHDYLVPALQEWLAIKKRGTPSGQASIKLVDLTAQWSLGKDNRHLPSLLEYVAISRHVPSFRRTPIQAQMMKRAGAHHLKRLLAFATAAMFFVGLYMWQSRESYQRNQDLEARSLADRLLIAEGTTLAKALLATDKNLTSVSPILRSFLATSTVTDARRGKALLALLPEHPQLLEEVSQDMLEAGLRDFLVYRERLRPWKEKLLEQMYRIAREPGPLGEKGQLRALGAIAGWNPVCEAVEETLGGALEKLLNQNQLFVPEWVVVFTPLHSKLLTKLVQCASDLERPSNQRDFATAMACSYAATDDKVLFQLLVGVEARNATRVMEKMLPLSASMTSHLLEIMKETNEGKGFEERKRLAIEQGVAGAVLISQNHPDGFAVFGNVEDSTARTAAQKILPFLGAGPEPLLQRIKQEENPLALMGLVVALGDFDLFGITGRQEWQERFLTMYASHQDPGLHGALDWLLRKKWDMSGQCDAVVNSLKGAPGKDKRWMVNSQGQTLVKIQGPVKYLMGSFPDETVRFDAERLHHRTIPRSFAMGMKEVTVEEFHRLVPTHKYIQHFSKTPDCPMNCVSWFCAAEYCNKLTELEFTKADCCYIPNEKGEYGDGMRMADGFLGKKGYRLPTEAEWEYCCRAGTTTTYHFGNDANMLERHGFCQINSKNHLWPVGSLRPNNLGFFDMSGNVYEWLQDKYFFYPPANTLVDSGIDMSAVSKKESRGIRNGAFYNPPEALRSASRNGTHAEDVTNSRGVRIVRTLE